MPLKPCSSCLSGDHAACDAAAPPFCGCRNDGHQLDGPITVAISDLPTPPPAPDPVEPAAAVGAAVADDVLAALGLDPALVPAVDDLADDEDDAEPLDVGTGVVGITEAPEPTTDPPAGSPDNPIVLVMPWLLAGPRPEGALVSLWDSSRGAVLADPEEETTASQVPADLDAVGPATSAEHTYGGSDETPYACSCGANPGSLNKLASHLGITGQDAAVAALAKLTVPFVLGTLADQRPPTPEAPPAVPAPEPTDEVVDLALAAGVHRRLAAAMVPTPPTEAPAPVVTDPLPDEGPLVLDLDGLAADALARILVFRDTESVVVVDAENVLIGELPAALARHVLAHFGWDQASTYTDPDGSQVDPLPVLSDDGGLLASQAASPGSEAGPATLAPLTTTRPVRVQVARLTTTCAVCDATIEPGTPIGLVPGQGWGHLNHDAA